MTKKSIFKASRILVTIVLCAVVVASLFLYVQLNQKEKVSQIDLFTLVPQDVLGIIETNNIKQCFYELEETSYYENSQQFHFSAILEFLSQKVDGLAEKKGHGLSTPMSNILVSFHQPGQLHDQVLYGHLGNGDQSLMKRILKEISSDGTGPKEEKYRGKTIAIYPISNTEYLSCFFQSNCYAISFQKKLIERVIDAYKDKTSMQEDSLFSTIYAEKKAENGIRLYARSRPISEWTRYDLRFSPNSIYLTGYCFGMKPEGPFMNSLINATKKQLISPEILPDHTTTFIQMGISNVHQWVDRLVWNDSIQQRNAMFHKTPTDVALYDFLDNYAQNEIDYIEFQGNQPTPNHQVLLIPMKFNQKTTAGAWRKFATPVWKAARQGHTSYPIYRLDGNPLMSYLLFKEQKQPKQLMAIIKDDCMLISDKEEHLRTYLSLTAHALKDAYYTFELADEANFTLFTDLERIHQNPEGYQELLPPFLFQHLDFFRQCMLTMQYIESTGPMNTNIILNFK